jgi:hypothetical protein
VFKISVYSKAAAAIRITSFYVKYALPHKGYAISVFSCHPTLVITENMNKFRIQGLEQGNDIYAIVFKAGRYLSVVAYTADDKLTMTFMDLQNDEATAKMIATQYENDLQRIFMKNFYELSNEYKKNYDLVSLEVRPNISAN